jgi:ribosomal protein S27E
MMGIKNYEQIFSKKFHDQKGQCFVCGDFLSNTRGELAHVICKSKANIRKYGLAIIDHAENLRLTCPKCNSSVLIGGGRQAKIDEHINRIKSYEA